MLPKFSPDYFKDSGRVPAAEWEFQRPDGQDANESVGQNFSQSGSLVDPKLFSDLLENFGFGSGSNQTYFLSKEAKVKILNM